SSSRCCGPKSARSSAEPPPHSLPSTPRYANCIEKLAPVGEGLGHGRRDRDHRRVVRSEQYQGHVQRRVRNPCPAGWSRCGAETASSSWQQVTFATPVAIQANTVYVASYFAPNGHYSGNLNYFATQGVDTPPLHALANAVAGGNGVYAYGGANSFPNSTYQALNYWVDVGFSTSAQ